MDAGERIAAIIITAVWVSVAFAQTYKWGQRHPDAQKFTTYAAAVQLANERYDKGWSDAHCGKNQECEEGQN